MEVAENISSQPRQAEIKSLLRDFYDLSKPGIGFYALITTFAAFYMASPAAMNIQLLLHVIIATAFVTAGGGALNQVIEIQSDSEMKRTEKRPLPAGRVSASNGLLFGTVMSVIGVIWLLLAVNSISALLAIGTLVGYLFVYTPLKKYSSLSTIIGAFPGAIPILIGWVAVTGTIDARGWTLFALLFLWQIPHFLAIAWMYRNDYSRAGFPMITVVEPEGISAAHQTLIYLVALLPVSILPTKLGMTGMFYAYGALALSVGFLLSGLLLAFKRTNSAAKRLLFASILYLPLILILMLIDKL